jgi:hypothetical protein
MARTTSRSDGPELPAVPTQAANTVEEVSPLNTAVPARDSDPANGQAHPTSRKPNAPTGGGGHGNSGGGK